MAAMEFGELSVVTAIVRTAATIGSLRTMRMIVPRIFRSQEIINAWSASGPATPADSGF
jgi:hypothetical protein